MGRAEHHRSFRNHPKASEITRNRAKSLSHKEGEDLDSSYAVVCIEDRKWSNSSESELTSNNHPKALKGSSEIIRNPSGTDREHAQLFPQKGENIDLSCGFACPGGCSIISQTPFKGPLN
jgi:hypothetical protein